MRRVPFVVSAERVKGSADQTHPPSIRLYEEYQTVDEALKHEAKDSAYVILGAGYFQLPRKSGNRFREATLHTHAMLIHLLKSDDSSDHSGEFNYVLGLWLNQAFRAGIKVGKKLRNGLHQQQKLSF